MLGSRTRAFINNLWSGVCSADSESDRATSPASLDLLRPGSVGTSRRRLPSPSHTCPRAATAAAVGGRAGRSVGWQIRGGRPRAAGG